MNLKYEWFYVFIVLTLIGLLSWWLSPDIEEKIQKNTQVENSKIDKSIKDDITENTIETNTSLNKNIKNDLYENIKKDLINYFDRYVIESWDTMTSIANKYWITNYKDLILLNSILWVEFEYLNKNVDSVVLQKWYAMYVPKYGMLGNINNKLNELRKIQYTLEINNKIDLDNNLDVKTISQDLYPNSVVWLWVEKMLGGFIEAQKREFDPYLPRIVDVQWQTTISCANLIRTLLAYSVDKQSLTDKEKAFFQAQWLDAWILPEALKQLWYIQKFNLMNNFSEYYIWTPYPVQKENQQKYEEDLIKLWKYLESDWIVWSILPIYFRYSDYTKVVAKYNRDKEFKHYNTHQSILAWVDTISFEARNVWNVLDWRITKFEDLESKQMTLFDFVVNFVQQRWDYGMWSLMTWTKKIVRANLHTFQSLIKIKVNWVEIDLSEEFKKDSDKMLLIKPEDKIEIYGPIMIDWLHMLSSPDISRRIYMNARTRFYFEFILIWNFLPSELLEPSDNVFWIWIKKDDLISKLDLKWVYSIKVWDTVESAIKNKILVYEKENFDKLDKKNPNYNFNYEKLLNYYYSQQVKALKISWYMQSENNINPSSFNINAPIPYYDNNNISEVFEKYVSNMEENIIKWNTDKYVVKNFIQVTTFPLDSYKSLLNRITEELKNNLNNWNGFDSGVVDEKYPNINLLFYFNELQQRKFLDKFLSSSKKSENLVLRSFLNWKISEWITMILSLKDIDKIISEISKESYTPNMELSPVDEFSIDLVLELDQNKNIIENILYMESYIPVWSVWARRLVKQFLENNSFLQQRINLFWLRVSSNISSYWDFQLRLLNLYKWLNEEWLNRNQLLKAFSYLEDKRLIDYVSKLDNISKRRIHSDLELVNDINILLLDYDNVDDDEKSDYRQEIVSKLEKILVLDDWTWKNIVWKIVWASLLNDKINLHFQKLNWMLQASGENISDIYNSTEQMQSYEKLTILINNLWELNVVYWLAENYIIRNLESIERKLWKKYTYPSLETTSTLWQFIYGKYTFLDHVSMYKKIIWEMKNDSYKIIDTKDKDYMLINSALATLEWVIDSFLDDSNSKSTIENIYELFRNKKIKAWLIWLNKSSKQHFVTSILPINTEYSWIEFRDVFFRYINTRDIKREWPWFLSKIVDFIR